MTWFVGIDVSKKTLDVFILGPEGKSQSAQIANTPAGHASLLKRVRRLAGEGGAHWCMEATGSYHLRLAMALVEAGELTSVENPRRVKNFAVAMGMVQKTDRADARAIASYAQKMAPGQWKLAEPGLRELILLDRRLTDLSRLCTQEGNRLEHPCLPEIVREGIEASIREFERQIKQVEARIEQLLAEDEELSELRRLLQTIPGLGPRGALTILVEAADLSQFEKAQDLAARFGLNPKLRRSGTSLSGRTRISKQGNAHARCRLYMPAVVGIKQNPTLKAHYDSLVSRHKPKKSALLACERKLVMIAFGVLKSRKPYDPALAGLTC